MAGIRLRAPRWAFPVTDEFARRNQNTTAEGGATLAERLVARAHTDGVRISITLTVAFGCPFEDRVAPETVLGFADRVTQVGPDELVLADTIGVGVPSQVRELLGKPLGKLAGDISGQGLVTGCHFHDTRNTGLTNTLAAIESDATVLDASIGGTGGCPFAPNATGNIATEDLVYLLHGMGYKTGVDLEALIECAGWLSGHLGKELPGKVHKAGTFDPTAS